MKTKCLLGLLVIGWQAALAGPETNGIVLAPEVFDHFGAELRANSLSLLAADARIAAARANVDSVRTWADPEVSLSGMIASDPMRRDEGDLLYGVSQKLPLFGQPRAARSAAAAEARSTEAGYEDLFQRLRLALVKQLLATALLDHHVVLAEEDLGWATDMALLAEERFKAGGGSSADVLRLQNERDLIATGLTNRLELARQAQRELNRLLGRDPATLWPHLHLPSPGPEIRFDQALRESTRRDETRLRVLRHEAESTEARVDVVRRSARPDVKVFGELRQYSGSGEIRQGMIGIGLSIPWFNRSHYRSDLSRARAEAEAARYEVDDYERIVPIAAEQIAIQANNSRRQTLTFHDRVVPRTGEAIELLRQKWTSGDGDLLPLLEARRDWINARRMEAEATVEQWQSLAELALYCGLPEFQSARWLKPGVKATAP